MPRSENGQTERMEKQAGLSAHTKRRMEALAPGKGIQRLRKKANPADQELPLKRSGDRREVADTRAWEHDVRGLLEDHPEHFQALRALVEGRPEEVTERQSRDLRKWLYLARDRSPLPGARAIIEAAYRTTGDGPAIVDPFDVKAPEDAAALRRADKHLEKTRERGLDRIIRKVLGEDQGGDKGRSF